MLLQLIFVSSVTSMVNSFHFDRLISFGLALDGRSTQIASGEGDGLPDSQAGHFQNLGLGILSASGDDHDDSSDQCQSTEDWRNGKVLMLFFSGVDRPDIQHFFLMGVIEPLISQRQASKNNQ